jgi:hypothetical protein
MPAQGHATSDVAFLMGICGSVVVNSVKLPLKRSIRVVSIVCNPLG